MPEKHPREMSTEELIADVKTLPDPGTSIMSRNERVLIELCQALAAKLETATDPDTRDPWSEHEIHSGEDWRADVANGDTRRGYWDWVDAQVEQGADDSNH